MPDVTEPELNQRERLARDYILPLFSSNFDQPAQVGEERVHVVNSILAKQYVEHANLDILWKLFAILLLYDFCFRLDSVIYGLTMGVLGSIALALPNLYTPELLAEEAFREPRDLRAEIEARAERSVRTNIGVTGLTTGFVWQIFTISGPIPSELVSQNYLEAALPNWIGFAAILVLAYVILADGVAIIRQRI